MKKKILVIGSTNIDNVAAVAHIPEAGETIISSDFALHFGGKGANQAYAAGKLGGDVAFLSAVGADAQGESALQNLNSVGVDTRNVVKLQGVPTGMAWISVSAGGENCIVAVPGANAELNADRIRAMYEAIESADIILIQLEICLEGVCEAIRIAGALGKTIVLDPAPAAKIPDEVLKYVTFATPNESELKLLTGLPVDSEENVKLGAEWLLERGVQNVLVTRGARGSMLINRGETRTYPAYRIQAVDTTAAGDTFNAAFGVMLSGETSSLDEAIAFASAAAAVSAMRNGAQESAPTIEETRALMIQK